MRRISANACSKLMYRTAHLINSGVKPDQLLLLTFTNKAAGEMKGRLESLLGYYPGGLWAGTFHSIGARILRHRLNIHEPCNAEFLGREKNFTIYDEDDMKGKLKKILKDTGVAEEDRKTLMKRNMLLRIISQSRNTDKLIIEIVNDNYGGFFLAYANTIEDIAKKYEKAKLDSNAFDFDDLLLCWLKLFENNSRVKGYYREKFAHVLVDEYQDTNVLQAQLVDLFRGSASICVVGDDAQSIYAFRCADIKNILTFPDHHENCQVVLMEQNYRSTPEIVELANYTISMNSEKLSKKLFSTNPSGEKPFIAGLYDSRQEATYVLQCIWELQNNGVELHEIAVLYRSSYLTADVELALNGRGISYKVYGGLKFFQKAHIKDVLAYLQVAYNPNNELAWRRLCNLQTGLGEKTFNTLWGKLKLSSNPLEEAIEGKVEPSRGKAGWAALVDTLKKNKLNAGIPIYKLFQSILDNNYDQILRREYPDQYEERYRGIERLMIYAERFDTLPQFLESLALEESIFADTETAEKPGDGHLTLSTIHSAKGKEWDAVFIIGMNQGHFPSNKTSKYDHDEERRLFYVASTRARRYLYMTSYYEDYRSYGAISEGPSIFLDELPHECFTLSPLNALP